MEAHIAKFREILGDNLTQDMDIIAPNLREWRDKYFGNTPIMLMPTSTQEVQAIMKYCFENNIKITPQGGNTGLVGAQIPFGEVLISLKKLNKIRSINIIDDNIICDAGVTLKTIQDYALENGAKFPLSLASEGMATIGGLIATNAGGVHVRKYGMMRQMVMGLEVVLPNGEIYSELTALRKDNTGYDLKHIFIGAEGTLGIITGASLKLAPIPKYSFSAMLGHETIEDCIKALHFIESETASLSAFEMMNKHAVEFGIKNIPNAKYPFKQAYNYTSLIEFETAHNSMQEMIENTLLSLCENGIATDCTIAQNLSQTQDFWHLRESMSAAQKPEGKAAKHDISVPISKIPEFFERAEKAANEIVPSIRISAFGHISDGNIHYDVLRPINLSDDDYQSFIAQINHAVHDIACILNGSISAEHGIGIARKDEFIAREPVAHLELMKAIKNSLDPKNICNPRLKL